MWSSYPTFNFSTGQSKKKKALSTKHLLPIKKGATVKAAIIVRIAERCLQSLLMDSSFFELLYSTCADVLSSVPFLTREASAVANT